MASNKLTWQINMEAGQSSRISITYSAHGMKKYSYNIPVQRGIENFNLIISTDTNFIYPISTPKVDVLDVERECSPNEGSCIFEWHLNRLVMAPTLGITFRSQKVETPLSDDVIDIIRYMPRALVLLSSLVILSMLTLGGTIKFSNFTLFIGIFSAQFLGLMGVSILGVHYAWAIPILAIITLAIQVLILQETHYRVLYIILSALFGIAYSFAGLLPSGVGRNSFDSIVFVAILIYLFVLVLYSRIQKKKV